MPSTDLALPSEGISTILSTQNPLGPRKGEPQSPLLQPGKLQYSPAPATYGEYSSGLTSPQSSGFRVADSMAGQGDALVLPAMPAGHPASTTTCFPKGQGFDTTGQVAPPGVKPRVTATLWEDEGSLCFQVEAKGVVVARREGNPEQVPSPTVV
jgi:enhanced filamentous growth protein 1